MHVSHKRSFNTLCDSVPNLEFGWSPHAGFNVEACENDAMNLHQTKKIRSLTNDSFSKKNITSLTLPIKMRVSPKANLPKITNELLIKFLEYLPKSRRKHHSLIGSFHGHLKEILFSLEDVLYITEGVKQDLTEQLVKEHNNILSQRLQDQETYHRRITEEIIENKLKNSTFDYMS